MVYKKPRKNLYQYYKPGKTLYQVLQVTCATFERALKSKVCVIKSSQYHAILEKNLLLLALLLVLCTHNNTDGNKFVIFSGIACTVVS